MYRVKTLVDKLQAQLQAQANAAELLLTVQMLQHELLALQADATVATTGVAVQLPPVTRVPAPTWANTAATNPANNSATVPEEPSPFVPAFTDTEPDKLVAVLQVDEAELAAELEELKKNAATLQQMSVGAKPPTLFDLPSEEIPTLAHQPAPPKEIHELINNGDGVSLNDLHAVQPAAELSDKLSDSPIKDLKKAIGINDRFLFINELFRGDEAMYERSIKTINSFSIWPEAEYWIRRELKTKLGWLDAEPTVKLFDQLVKRRFA
jgi:hypothetical protein